MINQQSEQITADHVGLVMQCLGRFHAISFALKDQQPEKYEELTFILKAPIISREFPSQRELLKRQKSCVINSVSGEEDANLLATVKRLFKKEPADIAMDCNDPRQIGTAMVISHGDAWQNNFIFRYDNNGKPVEVSLLDWQLSYMSTPIYDISLFLFCSITKDLRNTHYDTFLKIYHESLSAHIRR